MQKANYVKTFSTNKILESKLSKGQFKLQSYIQLNREFSPVVASEEDRDVSVSLSFVGQSDAKSWDDILQEFRCVILAEAGAGKTEEFRQQAFELECEDKAAFFIRIEDIDNDFERAFEIGSSEKFEAWLKGTNEAWFFLDSVDEARLNSRRAFEKALRVFSNRISNQTNRAHIYISSRPYAWGTKTDKNLVDGLLFRPKIHDEKDDSQQAEDESALVVYIMNPLKTEQIKKYSLEKHVVDVTELIDKISRTGLWSLAERPFDLDGIIAKWKKGGALGSRIELLKYNIEQRLAETHSDDRSEAVCLTKNKALEGARRLAAAVVLTCMPGIKVPGGANEKPSLNAEEVLVDWQKTEIRALLETGIFNDVIYDSVRFRHREIRELLASQWFDELLKSGGNRHQIEGLFFRQQYGQKLVTPLLRPILTWLALFDSNMRQQAIELEPEIMVESGDPSILPLPERSQILNDIVHRIVEKDGADSARDNTANARIAKSDLAQQTLKLIHKFQDSDDAIFFLGRLVWQGSMTLCVQPLIEIALNSDRGLYARRAATRAIMTVGSREVQQLLWAELNTLPAKIPFDVLSEIIKNAEISLTSVKQLVISLEKVDLNAKRHESKQLKTLLNGFIDKLSLDENLPELEFLIAKFAKLLDRAPYLKERRCRLSEDFAWLLGFAAQIIEKLIAAKCQVVLSDNLLRLLLKISTARERTYSEFADNKNNLKALVPEWPDLNESLYWLSVRDERNSLENEGKRLTDVWEIIWAGHFWSFTEISVQRLFNCLQIQEHQDNKLVVLSTALRVFGIHNGATNIPEELRVLVAGDVDLEEKIREVLTPREPFNSEHAIRREERRQKRDKEEQEEQNVRQKWIDGLRDDPKRIWRLRQETPGIATNDILWLYQEIGESGINTSRTKAFEWCALVPVFGEEVAREYRDFTVEFWRHYSPKLQSEPIEIDSTNDWEVIFGSTGLEIEAREVDNFPNNLSDGEVIHALRYFTCEIDGFPLWLETFYVVYPEQTIHAIATELQWELNNTPLDKDSHYVLYSLLHHAKWSHSELAPLILNWLLSNPDKINVFPKYCIKLMISGDVDEKQSLLLIKREVVRNQNTEIVASWFALWVGYEPDSSIPKLEGWLSNLEEGIATNAAMKFVLELVGSRRTSGTQPLNKFAVPKYLITLYKMMHRFIKVADDVNRAGGGVYSPTLRDDAQDARNHLFSLLSDTPGKEAYSAIKELEREHPVEQYRPWMTRSAKKRAEVDGDIQPWNSAQVYEFEKLQLITPNTHRQLFELGIAKLTELKNWLECGNDSPWQTWGRVKSENELRNLIAGWLNQNCRSQYTTTQEPELANSQRMDISLDANGVDAPVPIELKLLDKEWSGNKLCERLRNQLVGDYLRENGASCGIFLLVSAGTEKRWDIDGSSVELEELKCALTRYWNSISEKYPIIENVEIMVIDLAVRGSKSDS